MKAKLDLQKQKLISQSDDFDENLEDDLEENTEVERVRKQTGVIPYDIDPEDGSLYVLLISSRHAGNWGIPKGKKEKHLGKKQSAEVEAWEEAGLKGKADVLLGTYTYRKGSTGVAQTVNIYGMRVRKVKTKFPEQDFRKRKWFLASDAVKKVDKKIKPSIQKLIKAYTKYLNKK